MIPISWSQFEKNQSTKDVSFEAFCYQIAFSLYHTFGFFEDYYNTPGSEFYLLLEKDCPALKAKAGDIIGWQVKWWFDKEDNTSLIKKRRDELETNFKTTLSHRPNIKQWIICTPGPFDQKAFDALTSALSSNAPNIKVIHWNKNTFQNLRSDNYDLLGSIFHHYFNTQFISFAKIKEYSESRISYLKNKFDTDLYTSSRNDVELFFLADIKAIFSDLNARARYLIDEINKIEKRKNTKEHEFPGLVNKFVEDSYVLLDLCIRDATAVYNIISSGLTIDKCKQLREVFIKSNEEFGKIAAELNEQIKNKEHLVSKDDVRDGGDWYFREIVITPINNIRAHLFRNKHPRSDKEEDGIFEILSKVFQKDVHILSSAGYGKTNIVCNFCNTSLEKRIPCILVLGSAFRNNALPQKTFTELLNWSINYSFDQVLQALDNFGFILGHKIPIIIDGLNESTPYDLIWKTHIKDIIKEVSKHDYLLLVTTCRDRYIEAIFETNDIKDIRHTMTLYGLEKNPLDAAIRKYFKKYQIEPISWAFNKEIFSNPLLLKIFSEVNEKCKGITISLAGLFKSIDAYIDKIELKASVKNSSSDPILRNKIKQGLRAFSERLWRNGSREISLVDFHNLIDPSAHSLSGSITERLLDEGLCFQKNLSGSEETVQFTYDLVAGYCICTRYLMPILDFEDFQIKNVDLKKELDDKVFSADTGHSLQQDILTSLIHCFSEKYNVQLFEIIDTERVIAEMFNNIDFVIGKPEVQERLLARIKKEDIGSRNFKLLFEKLFECMYHKNIHGLGGFAIKILSILNQVTIDIYWTELLRKNRYSVEDVLVNINRAYRREKTSVQIPLEDLHISVLATGSIDKHVRSIATENLFLVACRQPQEVFQLVNDVASQDDIDIIESVVVSICGAVLTLKSVEVTKQALSVLSKTFTGKGKNSHVCIIDYVQTIQEFATQHLNIEKIPKIKFNKAGFNISMNTRVLQGRNDRISIDFPQAFDIDLYDFNKYQASSLASSSYKKASRYTQQQCLVIILNHLKTKGFNKSIQKTMQELFVEPTERTFPRKIQGSYKEYFEKYLWQSYYEFAGHLYLSSKLKKDKELPRYRSSYTVFDPTFPALPNRFQLITDCFLPINRAKLQAWVKQIDNAFIDHYYTHSLHGDGEWVLISANITQESDETNTRWRLSVTSFLIDESQIGNWGAAVEKGHFRHHSNGYSHLFAGEINWSPFADNDENSYWLKPYGMVEVVKEYSWRSWSNERDDRPNFEFLNPGISRSLELVFNVTDLSFQDPYGRQATRIVWTENQILYFMRRELVEKMIRKKKKQLVWYEFVSKYGNWDRRDKEIKLNPSRMDIHSLKKYPDKSYNIFRFSRK